MSRIKIWRLNDEQNIFKKNHEKVLSNIFWCFFFLGGWVKPFFYTKNCFTYFPKIADSHKIRKKRGKFLSQFQSIFVPLALTTPDTSRPLQQSTPPLRLPLPAPGCLQQQSLLRLHMMKITPTTNHPKRRVSSHTLRGGEWNSIWFLDVAL